jgi:hypothetical protein
MTIGCRPNQAADRQRDKPPRWCAYLRDRNVDKISYLENIAGDLAILCLTRRRDKPTCNC